MRSINTEEYRTSKQLRLALLAGSALAAICTSPALAQSAPPDAPPVRIQLDQNGVDLATGNLNVTGPAISIGVAGSSGLTYVRSSASDGATDDYDMLLHDVGGNPAKLLVYFGRTSVTFTLSGGVYSSENGDGATVVSNGNGTFTYRGNDSTTITFATQAQLPGYLYPTTLQRPTGEATSFFFRSETGYIDSSGTPSLVPIIRLQSVTNNHGYQVKFEYQSNTPTDAETTRQFLTRSAVKLINNAVDACDPNADSCSGLTQNWPSLSFSVSQSGADIIETIADTQSRETKFRYNNMLLITGITKPGSASDDITATYDAEKRISSLSNSGLNYTYTWAVSGFNLSATLSDPGGVVQSSIANHASKNLLSRTDGLNRTTSYTEDAFGRITETTFPEGNKVGVAYDARGNVTQTTRVAKPGSGLANLVTSASFPASCANAVICNKPIWTRDERNFQTDYTYDPTHGGVLTVTAPAPVGGGARPEVRHSYSPLQAYYKNSSGSIVASGQPITKLTGTSTCLNSTSCANFAEESKTTISYGPQSAVVANNLLPVSVTAASGDGAVSSTTSTTYDAVGNVASVDGPLAGSADTTVFRYDVSRNVVGTIGPDPDGGGALPNPATRITRDPRDRVTLAEQGTTPGQTTTAWNSFSPAESIATTYNGLDQVLTQTVKNGATNYALTQNSYDSQGRLDCTAQRMNIASYASLPSSACTGVGGANDRIVKLTYNAADQVIQTQSGFGSATVATESTDYTNNGKTSHVVDAQNNRTTYEYDGHDRLLKTRYPVASQGANSSSTTDFVQLTYGDNVNVTGIRLRGETTNMTLAYDNLNRVTSRTPPSESAITTSYNLLGMITQVQRGSLTVTNTYDALGRRTGEAQPYGSYTFLYNPAGSLTRITWADGFYASYDYDNASRITAIRENGGAALATYTYDSLGRRASVSNGNATSQTWAYDAVSRLAGLKLDLAGTTNDHTIGQVAGVGTPLAWNAASQITGLVKSNNAYAYTDRYNVNRGYSANGLNQYTLAGAVSHTYDARGNLTASGTSSYTYSKFNELKTGPNASSLTYDGLGRLVQYDAPSATRFSYAGPMMLAEHSSANAILRRYVPGPGALAGGDEIVVWYEGAGTSDKRWLFGDERGSVVAVADASGNALAVNRYDEYGIPATGNLGRFQYTGQMWLPELGLYNYKARMYSATLGRFMQTDPIGYGDGLNWYAYVGNDPVNKVDPSGSCGLNYVSAAVYVNSSGLVYSNRQVPIGFDCDASSLLSNQGFLAALAASIGQNIMDDVAAKIDEIVVKARRPKTARDVDCKSLIDAPGMIEFSFFSAAAARGGGVSGALGSWRNTQSGASGKFWTAGAGVGWEAGAGFSWGNVRSLGDFSGLGMSLQVANGLGGGIIFNKAGDPVGAINTISTPGKGGSFTFTGTKIYSCKAPGL